MKQCLMLIICTLLVNIHLHTSFKSTQKPFSISRKTTEILRQKVQQHTRQQQASSCAQELQQKYNDLILHDKDYHKLYLVLQQQLPRLKYYLATQAQYTAEFLLEDTRELIRCARQCIVLLQAKRTKTMHDICILEKQLNTLMP
ncbi:hypothetical protein KBD08_00830 [Candidatus Babeliales bacterium]|nr:hypothetical protein [Candidatus Babeliales bacterium]